MMAAMVDNISISCLCMVVVVVVVVMEVYHQTDNYPWDGGCYGGQYFY